MIGRMISQYQLMEKLGKGGMGEIYRAQDTRLSRTVAIKVLLPWSTRDDEVRRRFLQEARAASSLNHPNIITVHDIVFENETAFMVMEYVVGSTLASLIPPNGLPVSDVLGYSVQMADALIAAHDAGIVHRDLKPENVMVTEQGLVKILDFGLAKLSHPAGSLTSQGDATVTLDVGLTVDGSILGTASYMSPEQAEGKAVDARSDIFSFGVVLYEMLTGRRAFVGDSAVSILSAILRDDVRPISESTAGIPPALEKLVRRCLAKSPGGRWQSMRELRAALVTLRQESESRILLKSPGNSLPSRKLLAGICALLIAGLGAWWSIGHRRPPIPVATLHPGPSSSPAPPAATDSGILTNDGIVAMIRAKVPPSLILQQIQYSKTHFDLSVAAVIRLTEAGVSPDIIEAMRNPARPIAPPSQLQPSAAFSRPETQTTQEIRTITIPDGLPVSIRLTEDIPADAEPGRPLHFAVLRGLRIGEVTVVAANAPVTGEITAAAKRRLFGGKKVSYQVKHVAAVDGGSLSLRTAPSGSESDSSRPVEVPTMPKPPKGIAALAGTEYVAYTAGDQHVTIRK